MPKDNEVDEKVPHWGDLMRELRSQAPEGLAPLVDRLSFACDQRLSFLLHERYEQDLSHTATVAELRAEVEKARIAGIDACDKLTALWQKDIDRADAAERRVVELIEIISRVARCSYSVCTQIDLRGRRWSEAYLDQVLPDILATLTGADPT